MYLCHIAKNSPHAVHTHFHAFIHYFIPSVCLPDAFAIHLSVGPVREFLKVSLDAETSRMNINQLFGQAMADLGRIGYNEGSIVKVNPNPLDDLYMDLPDVQYAAVADTGKCISACAYNVYIVATYTKSLLHLLNVMFNR